MSGDGRQVACKPGSVLRATDLAPGRWPFISGADYPAPHAVNPDDRPEAVPLCSISSLSDLAPGGACRAVAVTGNAVGSYPTVSPLPATRAVCSLWRFP